MTATQDTAATEFTTETVEMTDPDQTTLLSETSDQSPTVSVVLPTLNKEDDIRTCVRKVERAPADMGVTGEVIVSDSSSDRTPEIAREMGAIVVEPDRTGYGYAYGYGFRFARGKFIVMRDADTTYDFEELPKLFELVEDGADMAMGSRLRGEIKPGSMAKLHRYIGNPLLTRFLNFFYDADVSDAHSGMRVIRREALSELTLESDGMEFASEMIMAASTAGLDIRETPITYHERTGEATLDSFHDGWRHVRFIPVNAP
jgi:glycosyltransferase involved in cell wall biosynthesis